MSDTERGVSNVLGLILLVGIISLGILIVAFTGQSTVSDQTSQNNIEVANQVFEKADSQMSQLADQGTSGETNVDIPNAMEGGVETREGARYRLRLNDNPACNSTSLPLSSLQYEDEGTLVGYQGGGVWEYTENGGAGMRTPPDITYDNGQLSLSLYSVEGDVTNTDEISAEVNATRQARLSQNVSRALYTNQSAPPSVSSGLECNPATIEQATLYINNSQFADAWAQYARNNYDDEKVTVRPSGNLEPRENLSITFMLGDVSEPTFEVSDVEYDWLDASDEVRINATVTNTGGLTDTQTVEFKYSDGASPSTPADWTESQSGVTLNGSESTVVTATMDEGEIVTGGTDSFEVATEDDAGSTEVQFTGTTGPNLQIEEEFVTVNGNRIEEGNPADVIKYEVRFKNDGDMTIREPATYGIDNTKEATTDPLSFDPGDSALVQFPVPNRTAGTYDLNATIDGLEATNTTTVDTAAYFGIDDELTRTTNNVPDQVEANVTNLGGLTDSSDVYIEVYDRNSNTLEDSSNWDVTLNPGQSTIKTLDVPSDPGEYRYEVTTDDATTQGVFYIAQNNDRPNFVVNDISASPNPVINTSSLNIDYTINNAGDGDGTTNVDVRLEQSSSGANITLQDGTETIDAGDSASGTVVSNSLDSYPSLENDFAQVIVETDNTTATQFIEIVSADSGVSDEDGQIVIDRRIEARLLLLGSELEGGYFGGRLVDDNFVINGPTTMRLQIENESGTETTDLWDDQYDGDVNHPEVERNIVDDLRTYEYERTFENGTTLGVYATSYGCGRFPGAWTNTNVYWPNYDLNGDSIVDGAFGWACDDWGGERIRVSETQNRNNVVIRGDDEPVPAFGQAEPYQRDIDDLLPGDRIDNNGVLDLKPGERLILFELSEEDAQPEDADGIGDPDYNDAAVLFQTLAVNETARTPADIGIDDVDVPASVATNSTFDMDVTLNNTGGQDGTVPLEVRFAGSVVGDRDVTVGNKSERTVSFNGISTANLNGPKQYVVDITDDPAEQVSGYITVGSPDEATFQISDIDAPDVIDSREFGGTPQAEVNVTNTGGASGTQTVELFDGGTVYGSESLQLNPGESDEVYLNMPSNSGVNNYGVRTDDATVTGERLFVGEPNLGIVGVDVLSSSYSQGELIERSSLSEMSVEVTNDGSSGDVVGDKVEVNLQITDQDSGSSQSYSDQVDLSDGRRLSSNVPGFADFNTAGDLDTGYYDYTVQVVDEGTVRDQWTGEILIQSGDDTEQGDSPVDVDSGQITIGG